MGETQIMNTRSGLATTGIKLLPEAIMEELVVGLLYTMNVLVKRSGQ